MKATTAFNVSQTSHIKLEKEALVRNLRIKIQENYIII